MSVWTVLVAAGSGARFGRAKQYERLGRTRVIERSLGTAAAVSAGVVVVTPAADTDALTATLTAPAAVELRVVAGGATRSASVRAGLAVVPEGATVILVHDAARPLATEALFRRVIAAVRAGAAAAVPGVAVADSLRSRQGGVVDRDQLVAVQTPQGFPAPVLREAHRGGRDASDDAALVEALGHAVVIVEGEVANFKLTTPLDLLIARAIDDAG